MGAAVLLRAPAFVQGNGVERMPYVERSLNVDLIFTCPYCGWQGVDRRLLARTTLLLDDCTLLDVLTCGHGHTWTVLIGEATSLSPRPDGPVEIL
jgi:hypothetical protein